jgi:hypothetical protein
MAGKTALFGLLRGFSLGTTSGENGEDSTGPRKFQKASSVLTGFAQPLFTGAA